MQAKWIFNKRPNNAVILMALLGWLFLHNADLHYPGIVTIYAAASVSFAVLLYLEKMGSRPQTEFMSDLNGSFIIFAPYIPCLLWTLFSMAMQKRMSTTTNDKKLS